MLPSNWTLSTITISALYVIIYLTTVEIYLRGKGSCIIGCHRLTQFLLNISRLLTPTRFCLWISLEPLKHFHHVGENHHLRQLNFPLWRISTEVTLKTPTTTTIQCWIGLIRSHFKSTVFRRITIVADIYFILWITIQVRITQQFRVIISQ